MGLLPWRRRRLRLIVGLRGPEDEAEPNDVRLVVVDAVASDDLLVLLQLISLRFALYKGALNVYDWLIVLVNQFDGLDKFVIAAHDNVLYLIVDC